MKHYLALDLGAESGRAILGTVAEGKLALEELHRFPNTPVRIPAVRMTLRTSVPNPVPVYPLRPPW